MNGTTSPSRGRFRSGFLRRDGTALPNASRTMRRCTPSFLATPRIVPTPNSYSRRISSNSSTLALQSTATSAPGCCPQQSSRFFPQWANSKYRNHHSRLAKLGLFLVLARVAHQGSRLSAVRWAEDQAVGEVLGLGKFDEDDLYAALDDLAARQERMEKALYRRYRARRGQRHLSRILCLRDSFFALES